MTPTTKTIGDKFAPAIRVDRGDHYDLWYMPSTTMTSEDDAFKLAERLTAKIGRSIVQQLNASGYKTS